MIDFSCGASPLENRPNEESPDRNDPWLSNMGIFQDDPTFDDFLSEINIYRHEIDATEDI
jgi:hypothetical protein